jgi:hypothetical protein
MHQILCSLKGHFLPLLNYVTILLISFLMKKIIVLLIVLLLIEPFIKVNAQMRYDAAPASFLLPDDAPDNSRLFAGGLVSTGLDELNGSFSPDMRAFYYTAQYRNEISAIFYIRYEGGVWRYPEVVSFSGYYADAEPFVSSCGQKIFFSSLRPTDNSNKARSWNLHVVESENGKWGTPTLISFDLDRNERHPSVAENGDLYFYADYGSPLVTLDLTACNIYSASSNEEGFDKPVKLPTSVNSGFSDITPLISPDSRFLVFASSRPGGFGNSDLYVSFKNENDEWGEAQNLGSVVNSSASEQSPSLCPERKFLFFTSDRRIEQPAQSRLTYTHLKRVMLGPGNGYNDIYFVGAHIIVPDLGK